MPGRTPDDESDSIFDFELGDSENKSVTKPFSNSISRDEEDDEFGFASENTTYAPNETNISERKDSRVLQVFEFIAEGASSEEESEDSPTLPESNLLAPPNSLATPKDTHTIHHHHHNHKKVAPEDFEMLKVIGRGAYGKVFLVKQKTTSHHYAMKVLKKATITVHSKTTEHTKNERDILTLIQHPFIVKLHYAFQTDTRLYLILGYAQGGELFTYLKKEKMFTEDVSKFYIAELILAIEHLHLLGIIYRDLKPENVLLDLDGHVLLTDFGLSKVALDGTKTVCGTVEFMSPEIVEERQYDRCVDYWALGVMLFDMLAGEAPFKGGNRKKVLENVLKKKVVFPRHFTPNAKDICGKLLKKNPQVRLGSDSTGGVDAIKGHRFFKGMDWEKVERKEYEAPIKPRCGAEGDTSNFDAAFTDMPVELEDGEEGKKKEEGIGIKKRESSSGISGILSRGTSYARTPPNQDFFKGFSYVAESCLEGQF